MKTSPEIANDSRADGPSRYDTVDNHDAFGFTITDGFPGLRVCGWSHAARVAVWGLIGGVVGTLRTCPACSRNRAGSCPGCGARGQLGGMFLIFTLANSVVPFDALCRTAATISKVQPSSAAARVVILRDLDGGGPLEQLYEPFVAGACVWGVHDLADHVCGLPRGADLVVAVLGGELGLQPCDLVVGEPFASE